MPARPKSLLVALTVAAAFASGPQARAGSTDPVLAIGALEARQAGGGAIADLTGTLDLDDVIQVTFPLNVVVYQGNAFVRYPIGGEPESGTSDLLADGLQISDIATIESAGTVDSSARILLFEPNHLVVALPESLASGAVSAVAYVGVPGEDTVVSNTLIATVAPAQP